MCKPTFGKEARNHYINNQNNYEKDCGIHIRIPCSWCGYGFNFELLFGRHIPSRDYLQYMDVSCFKLPFNSLSQPDSYEQLYH